MDPFCLKIRLLGELDLQLGGTPLPPLESPRARSLLAYLLLHRDAPQPRQRLAFLLWPDSTEAQARTNLRHLLHTLQRAAPALAPFLDVSPATLRWRPFSPYWLDVAALEDALAQGEREVDEPTPALREAAELYRGDLLEGCYDEWIEPERARLRQRYLNALERLVEILEGRGERTAAIRHAERLLGHDPLNEAICRLLMRLHRDRGDRARALRVYDECVATLTRELGVGPSPETREAHEALLPQGDDTAGRDGERNRAGGPALVGRAAEWDRLTSLWRATERRRTQLVLVSGEAGIGKTRLAEELRAWCSHRGAMCAEARSYRAEGALAYGAVSAWLRSDALDPHLARLDRESLTELARLLPELLSRIPDLQRPEPLAADDQRARLYAAVSRAILGAGAPVLLVADDLQWCDAESLQLIHHLLRVEPDARVLVVATARREESCETDALDGLLLGLRMLDRVTEIELARLGAEETATLAERLMGRPLAEPDAQRLHAETEGNPLFVVEAIRAGWRGGPASGPRVSPKVHAVIQHRLRQLSDLARHLADLAATAGREFTTEVLGQAADLEGEPFVRALDELWRRGIIREHGAHDYDFSHDKIREVAYLALGPAQRRHHHLRVAHALERVHARDPGPVSAQIAAHYERAGVTDQAIAWYETAAEAAQRLYANSETIRLLGRALDLLRTRPASVEGEARELAILTSLLTPVSSSKGWASPHLAEVQQRALQLARTLRVAPPPQLLYSLALTSLARDDFEAAREHGEQLRARALAEGDDAVLVESDYVLGIAAFWQGELEAARRHFEAAVAGYRPDRRRTHLLHFWLDPQVVCLSRLGNTLLLLGEQEAAVRARDDALALADELGHPFSRTTSLVFAAYLAVEMEDTERLRGYVAALHAARGDHEIQAIRLSDDVLRAYLRVVDGESEEGIAVIRGTLADPAGVEHAPGMRAMFVRLLLAACTIARDTRGRLAAAEELLRMGGAARHWEAEAHRTRAECLAELGAPAGVIEAELGSALEVARRQGARLLERRAEASLLRYRESRGGAPDPVPTP